MAVRDDQHLHDEEFLNKEFDFDSPNVKRGPIMPPDPNKERITIRLDRDILGWFRERIDAAGGGSYQRAINDALRAHIERATAGPLEERIRRVLREELDRQQVTQGSEHEDHHDDDRRRSA